MTDHMGEQAREIAAEFRDFASLMVDEVIARVQAQLDAGQGLTVEDQKHVLAQLVTERKRLHRAVPEPTPSANAIEALTLPTPTRDEVARVLAAEFSSRPWDDVAANRRELKILASSNKAYSFSEDTKEDFFAAANRILQLIGKGETESATKGDR